MIVFVWFIKNIYYYNISINNVLITSVVFEVYKHIMYFIRFND